MQVLHPRCCALDVRKVTAVASLRIAEDSRVTTEVRTYDTTTASLIGLRDWLTANKCTHVAMEATGVYWKPVWHILADGEFELVLANAAHVNAARATSAMPNGSPIGWRTVSSARASCPIPRRRSYALCCARASNWCVRNRATSCAYKRRSRTPTSNWIR